jgi:hypothetical protein
MPLAPNSSLGVRPESGLPTVCRNEAIADGPNLHAQVADQGFESLGRRLALNRAYVATL